MWLTYRTQRRSEAERDSVFPTVVFCPVICAAGMNPAHSWHTMLVRDRGFAVRLGMHSFTSDRIGQLEERIAKRLVRYGLVDEGLRSVSDASGVFSGHQRATEFLVVSKLSYDNHLRRGFGSLH